MLRATDAIQSVVQRLLRCASPVRLWDTEADEIGDVGYCGVDSREWATSVNGRQFAPICERGPTFRDALWASIVSRRRKTVKTGQVSRKSGQFPREHSIAFGRQINDSHPHGSPFDKSWRVEIQ